MEEEDNRPPFWLQPTNHHRRRGRRSQASSICLNSGVLLVVLLLIAFIFVFVIIPSFLSFTSQIFRPHSIKKGWDSLNLVLVLFAIVCGFLSRNTNNNSNDSTRYYGDYQNPSNVQKSYPSTPRRWNEYQDRTPSYSNTLTRLRSFSSYPDLRQESSWVTNDERWRFYDDTHLNNYRFASSYDQLHHDDHDDQQQQEEAKKQEEEDDVGTKDIAVDTLVIHQKEVSYTPPLPPPPPPPSAPPLPSPSPSPSQPPPSSKVVTRRVKRTYQDIEHEKRREETDLATKNFYIPPPPPPPPPPVFRKNEKRRGKDFLISLRRKKKKQRQKSVENLDILFNPEPSTTLHFIPPSPPPPPPPPPPTHLFQNLFSSKKGKNKKIFSAPPTPPPPPPPLTRVSKIVSQNVTPPLASRSNAQVASATTHKPTKPVKTGSFNSVDDNVESGNASPLIPIPPPPPLPPFKMPAWKFVLDGDYVRVGSFNSSRSGSPDLESVEDAILSDKEQSSSPMAENKDTTLLSDKDSAVTSMFCASPDVNTKADNFIARFRAGLNLEKMNSVKGKSNLGPETSTS